MANEIPPPPPGFQIVAPPAPPPGFEMATGGPGMLGAQAAMGRDTRAPIVQGLSQGLSGYNESLGDVAGAPVDLATWLVNRIPQVVNAIGGEGTMGRIEDPIGGSDWFNSLQQDIGTVGADPTTDFQRSARNFGRVGGGVVNSALPLAGLARVTQAAGPGASALRGVFDTMVGGYRTAPGAAALSDVAAGVGAGAGSNIAQSVAPDSSIADFIGTLLGGLAGGGVNAAARGGVRGVFGGTPSAAANAPERLAAHDRLGLPATAAAVGGQPQGTGLQNVAQMLPLPFNPVQRVQDRVFRGTEDALRRVIEQTGGTPQRDAASIGEMMRDIAQGGDERARAAFSQRERNLSGRAGDVPVPTEPVEQQIERLMSRAGPEGRAALARVQSDLDSVRNASPEQLAGMQDTLTRLQALAAQDPALAQVIQPDIDTLTQQITAGRGVPYPVMDNTRKEIGARSAREGIPAQYMDPVYSGIRQGQEQALGSVDPNLPGEFNALKADERRYLSAEVPRSEGGDAVTLKRALREDVNPTSLANTEFGQILKDPARLATYWRNATETQRGDLQATIIDNLGKALPGQQRASGDTFSFNTFLTNYNAKAMPDDVKAIAFGEDTPLRRVLDDIATIAESQRNLKQTENRSQTGRVAINTAVGSLMSVGALTDILSTALATGLSYGATHAVVTRKLAEWVATQPPDIQQRVLSKALGLGIAGSPEEDEEEPVIKALRGR